MPRQLIYAALMVLALLHQDFWQWNDPTIVLGFLPIGLAYHTAYCILAAIIWHLAAKYAWPDSDSEGDDAAQ